MYRIKFILKATARAAVDCVIFWLSWMGSIYLFSFFFAREIPELEAARDLLWLMPIACVLFYVLCGVYNNLWSRAGAGTVIRLAAAAMLSSFLFYVALQWHTGIWSNPGIGVMAFYFLFTGTLAVRVYRKAWETVRDYVRRYTASPVKMGHTPVRTLIVGAGESAANFMMNKNQQGPRPRSILAMLDNDTRKHGYTLHGVTIQGDDSRIPKLVKELDIEEIVIAVPSMTNEDIRRIVKLTPVRRCKVRMLTGLGSDKQAETLRDVNIGDLLGRTENALNQEMVGEMLRETTVLVTGGGGSIGSEICRQLLNMDAAKIVIFDISENNAFNLKDELAATYGHKGRYRVAVRIGSVQDKLRLDEVFQEMQPGIVFHAAAYKHVPLMEECPRLALENNVRGTMMAAQAAARHGASKFIMISTDKAVNPTSVMGATKRLAELIVLGMNNGTNSTTYACVRFGNVLESNGSVIPTFRRQIEAGGPITVTHPDIIRYFMTISEAAQLVIEAGALATGGEIFILNMGQPVKIMDLAENLIRMAGLTPGVDIQIEIVGLRPGEKLYEELLLDEEGLTVTTNDKIYVAHPPTPEGLDEMVTAVNEPVLPDSDVRGLLRRFIPEYASVSD